MRLVGGDAEIPESDRPVAEVGFHKIIGDFYVFLLFKQLCQQKIQSDIRKIILRPR